MVGEPRPPAGADAVARLEVAALLGRASTLNQTGVPAMAVRQQGRHHGRLTVRPGGQYDRLIGPFHGNVLPKFSSECPKLSSGTSHRTMKLHLAKKPHFCDIDT